MKKNLIFILFLIVILPTVFANTNWFFEGNPEQGGIGGNAHVLFASNLGTNLNESNISYSRCNIDTSLYTPVATDFDNDGFVDYVITRTNEIYIYTSDCSLWNIISVGTSIDAMPVLINHNQDSNQEIAILTSRSLQIWEYSSGVSDFVLIANQTTALLNDSDFLACDRGDDTVCIIFKTGSTSTLKMNVTGNVRTLNTEVLPIVASSNAKFSGISFTDAFPNPKLAPFCWQANTTGQAVVHCTLITIDGTEHVSFSSTISGQAFAGRQIDWVTSAIIEFNGLFRVFTTYDIDTITDAEGYSIHDLNGNSLLLTTSTTSTQTYSNFMVGDYDKNGDQEACIGVNSGSDVSLTCYDIDLVPISTTYTTIEPTQGMVMAEFYPNYSNHLCLGNFNGIYCLNASNTTQSIKAFDTGLTALSTDLGHSIVVMSTGLSPSYLYSDDDNAFIIRNTIVTNACGDTICQSFETSYSCPTDCLLEEDLPVGFCSDSSTCPTQFPVCLFNECVALGTSGNASCTFDRDCPYDGPFCFSGQCIADSQLGIPNTTGVTDDEVTDRAFNNTIGILLGSSPLMKFMIGIGIVIGIIALIASYTPNGVAITLGGFLGLILTTVMGLVPIYVLILFIIGAVAFLILSNTVFSSTGGGG